jgi:anti-anti-sigma regulatory factor
MEAGIMFTIHVDTVGYMTIVECEGRLVRSEAALSLRSTVTANCHARIIVLDLTAVTAIEGGGLGMLVFLQRWARDHDLRLKLFNPSQTVLDRIERASSLQSFDIATLDELMALMADSEGPQSSAA